jgi:hypothetical protein
MKSYYPFAHKILITGPNLCNKTVRPYGSIYKLKEKTELDQFCNLAGLALPYLSWWADNAYGLCAPRAVRLSPLVAIYQTSNPSKTASARRGRGDWQDRSRRTCSVVPAPWAKWHSAKRGSLRSTGKEGGGLSFSCAALHTIAWNIRWASRSQPKMLVVSFVCMPTGSRTHAYTTTVYCIHMCVIQYFSLDLFLLHVAYVWMPAICASVCRVTHAGLCSQVTLAS